MEMEDDTEVYDLARELMYICYGGTVTGAALDLARRQLADLRRYAQDWDRAVADAAALAGDWVTVDAALPF